MSTIPSTGRCNHHIYACTINRSLWNSALFPAAVTCKWSVWPIWNLFKVFNLNQNTTTGRHFDDVSEVWGTRSLSYETKCVWMTTWGLTAIFSREWERLSQLLYDIQNSGCNILYEKCQPPQWNFWDRVRSKLENTHQVYDCIQNTYFC
jgi:hypothetical protein